MLIICPNACRHTSDNSASKHDKHAKGSLLFFFRGTRWKCTCFVHDKIPYKPIYRVTLVVGFAILPPNFGRWWGPTNSTLSFYKCRLSGGDTQTLATVTKFVNFLHLEVVGKLNIFLMPLQCLCPQWATWWNFYCLDNYWTEKSKIVRTIAI